MSLYVKGQSFVLHQIRKMIGEWLPWKQCISGSDPSLVVSIMIESPSPVTSTALLRVDHLVSCSTCVQLTTPGLVIAVVRGYTPEDTIARAYRKGKVLAGSYVRWTDCDPLPLLSPLRLTFPEHPPWDSC